MSAVCDTSPLCSLVLIGTVEIVPALFDEIFIPQAVAAELRHPKAPPVARDWFATPQKWLTIHSVEPHEDPRLRWLHPGKQEAIPLVQDLAADSLIIDEMAGRRIG